MLKKLLAAAMLVGLLSVVSPADPAAEATYSSPSDCTLANGYWSSFPYNTNRWWTATAESWNSYWTSTPDHCISYGYKPVRIAGFYGTSTHAQKSDYAYSHNNDNIASVKNDVLCSSATWWPCANFTSWHTEQWGYNTGYPFVHYNF